MAEAYVQVSSRRVKDEGMDDKPMVERIIQYVLTMADEEFAGLSVGKLAQLFEMDRYKISRQFKSQTGMTLEEFLYKEKMTRAALLLLAYRDITVKKVAERIGFCSPDYFIRKFRQFYGVVPGKYSEFKAKRSGIRDRRQGVIDRRQKMVNSSHRVRAASADVAGDRNRVENRSATASQTPA